jgi:hypothetical protein
MTLRCFFAAAVLFFAAAGCGGCDDPPPPDDNFDGNVIVGDATPPPDASRDAEPAEAGVDEDGGDAAVLDATEDAGDAEPGDAMEDAGEDAGINCSEPAVRTLTASTAVAEADVLRDMIVEITGTATIAALGCTGCADAGACTCTCTATVAIGGLVPLVSSACFANPGCSGNDCTQVCRPPVLGAEQSFRGRLNVRNSGTEKSVALELFSVSP